MMPFYVCPIIGDGTPFNPYRASVKDVRINPEAEIPTDPNGKPVNTHCVVEVAEVTVVAKLGQDGARLKEDVPLTVTNHATGETFIYSHQRDVPEGIHHTAALKVQGAEAVESKEAGRLVVEAKRGDVRI